MSNDFCMLCESIKDLNEVVLDRYIGELKEDGERIIAVKKGNTINLINRRKANKENVYIEITEALKRFDFDFIIDGEIVAEKGVFNDLQRRALLRDEEEIKKRALEIPTQFRVFDILSLNGENLMMKPLLERKKILELNIGKENERVKAVEFYIGEGIKELWENVKKENKEGIVLKIKDSIYVHKRSRNWYKLKYFKEISLDFTNYETNNAGVKLTSKDLMYEVQVQGIPRANWVIDKIKENGVVKVIVQYLDFEKTGKLRFPSCKEVVGYD
jgi:DNA ligase 1